MRPDAIHVRQRQERIVIHSHSRTPAIQLGVDVTGGTEQNERLVDQVAAKVKEQPAGILGGAALTPVVPRCGTPALETRLEAKGAPECFLGQEAAHRKKIPVPAAILVGGDEKSPLLRLGDERASVAYVGGKGFVDNDMEPVRQRLPGQRDMGAVGGRDHDEVEVARALPEMRG
jgi:hypothetical protein